jgi:hypothetical protein
MLVSTLFEIFEFQRYLSSLGTNHLNRPIHTYNGQGVTKPSLSESDRRAHAIVYMADTRPFCLPEEEKYLTKRPIAVDKASADQRLDPMSRVNFKKIYTIEHNMKVMNVGKATKDSLPAFLGYWRQSLQD